MTKRPETDTNAERDRPVQIEITREMIEAGRAVLRDSFGGETESANRFVDFADTVETLLVRCLALSGLAVSGQA